MLLAAANAGVNAVGWAVGAPHDGYGTILHTTDSGDTWTRQGSAAQIPDGYMNGVFAIDNNNAWVVGCDSLSNGAILRTTDGGANWSRQTNTDPAGALNGMEIAAVHGINGSVAWAVGYHSTILKTVDGGATWTRQTSPVADAQMSSVYAVSADVAWAVGARDTVNNVPTLLKTTDGGATWSQQRDGLSDKIDHLIDVSAVDADNAWIAGNQFSVLRTFNGGTHWYDMSPMPSGSGNDANGVCAVDVDHIWVVMDYDNILHSDDGGLKEWEKQTTAHRGFFLMRVCALNRNIAWIAGLTSYSAAGGIIMRTLNGGTTWVRQTILVDTDMVWISFVGAKK